MALCLTKKDAVKSKIEQWRIEMGAFSYDVIHKPGKLNVTPDALSRICGSILSEKDQLNLNGIYQTLGHPRVIRLHHFVESKNLPYSMQEVKEVCRLYTELKPRFLEKKKRH